MKPYSYTDEIAERICEELIEGKSLRYICHDPNMPTRATVLKWLENNPHFETIYARARVSQADFMDDKILETADNCTAATALADRVKIGAYQWRAARLQPKKYGDTAGRAPPPEPGKQSVVRVEGALPGEFEDTGE